MTRRLVFLAALVAAALALAACGGGGDDDRDSPAGTASKPAPIRLGTKNFTEQYILGELYAQALRAKGIEVELKSDIGSSEIVDQAMQIGSLDMYPEYIGVLLSEIAGRSDRPDTAQAAYEEARQFQRGRGYELLAMTPFSDSNAIAVTPATAERYGLRSIADLRKVPGGARIGAPPEFRTRFEGLVGLRSRYGLRDARVRALPIGKQYAALDRGTVDAAAVFTTDGMLDEDEYVILEDPRNLFSFQNVAPVVRKAALQRTKGLAEAVDAVSATLTTEAMRSMNAEVDLDGKDPANVARAFLQAKRLL